MAKVCAIKLFKEKVTLEELHEENDRVYKTARLWRNYAKYNADFAGLTKCRLGIVNLRTTFRRLSKISKVWTNATRIQKVKLNLYFLEMSGLKSLVKISSNINSVTTPVKTFILRKGKDD